ncbi:ferredoxin [Pseudonocardia sp. WMMC193]|uniref:ferredoxin n=1 Tax=Pseudonocardia sp. WMMC193 TaxID=2911965 RepID=UPI001F490B82|nr:ferredoxin [Pseudonocardia sp. WMMC193]MCF7548635.1 ferredoxin [Pseudonocardia sp. WMMC193]
MRLRVDPVACVGHGLCADLLPERITLDEWGYPLLDPLLDPPLDAEIPADLLPHARAAVAACPALALRLDRSAPDDRRRGGFRRRR